MRLFLAIIIVLISSCSHRITSPEVVNDREILEIIKEFKDLSMQNNIVFTKKVGVQFTKITKRNTIGSCQYGVNFRKISIDKEFWDNTSWYSKKTLLFHELSHCYCGRDHDFGKDKNYPEESSYKIFDQIYRRVIPYYRLEGYFEDNCPISIMHPTILSNKCMQNHYAHYVKEMFDRCEAW